MKEFFNASLRASVAMFFALLGVAVVVGIYFLAKDAYDKKQAKPFEEVQIWTLDLKSSIGVEVQARTKLIAGKLLVSAEVIGYPKYFADPSNLNASLVIEFLDKDGFKLISTPVKMSEFTTVVGGDGEKTGLTYQFYEYAAIEQYKRFNRLQVGWNLVTESAEQTPTQALAKAPKLDHCAPNISKSERLKRLEQNGAVRETGTGAYSAGGHSVSFFYDGSLLNCQ